MKPTIIAIGTSSSYERGNGKLFLYIIQCTHTFNNNYKLIVFFTDTGVKLCTLCIIITIYKYVQYKFQYTKSYKFTIRYLVINIARGRGNSTNNIINNLNLYFVIIVWVMPFEVFTGSWIPQNKNILCIINWFSSIWHNVRRGNALTMSFPHGQNELS